MRLYLCEKADQMRKIAKIVGASKSQAGYCESASGDVVVSHAIGHLLRVAYPKEMDKKYSVWKMENLPVIPTDFKLLPDEDKKKQLKVVGELIKRANEVVISTDKEREGELIAVELLEYFNFKGKRLRALYSAMDEKTLKQAFKESSLVDASVTYPKYLAALGRQRADWIIGLNMTMALTIANKDKYSETITAGRVQTAILALIAIREDQIKNHKPEDYYGLTGKHEHDSIKFDSSWEPSTAIKAIVDHKLEGYNKDAAKKAVDEVLTKVKGKDGVVSKKTVTPKKTGQPGGYDLGTLQKECDKKLNFSLDKTLKIVQELYEQGIVTYPRTDSCYIDDNIYDERMDILNSIKKTKNDDETSQLISNSNSSIRTSIWDSSKTTDHHAIIPTSTPTSYSGMSNDQRKVYDLIAKRFIAQFYPAYEYESTKISMKVEGETFSVTGNTPTSLGWKVIYQKDASDDEESKSSTLPMLNEGDAVTFDKVILKTSTTKPPARYTDGSLLDDMENAHKFIDDKKLKSILKEVGGIGRPSTSATHVKNIFDRKFARKDKKKIYLTDYGAAVYGIAPELLKNPATTAYWEQILDEIAENKGDFDKFMRQQGTVINRMIDDVKAGKCVFEKAIGAHKCTLCGEIAIQRKSKHGKYFKCTNTEGGCGRNLPYVNGRPGTPTAANTVEQPKEKVPCPTCDNKMIRKQGAEDRFYWQCEKFFEKEDPCKTRCRDNDGKMGDQIVKKTSEHSCPSCKDGKLVQRGSGDKVFWGCNNFPKCKTTAEDDNGKPKEKDKTHKCPKCKGGHLQLKSRKNDASKKFWACDGFPKCKNAYNDNDGKPDIKED